MKKFSPVLTACCPREHDGSDCGQLHVDGNLVAEVLHSMNGRIGDTQVCAKCGKEYQRDDWDFYSLCDKCFRVFDEEKMNRRKKSGSTQDDTP